MIEFRDATANRTWNQSPRPRQSGRSPEHGISPFATGSQLHTQVMKTVGSDRPSIQMFQRRIWRREKGRGKVARQGAHLFLRSASTRAGSTQPSARKCGNSTTPTCARANRSTSSLCELDRARHLGIAPPKEHSCRATLFLKAPPGGANLGTAGHGRRRAHAAGPWRSGRQYSRVRSAPLAAIR